MESPTISRPITGGKSGRLLDFKMRWGISTWKNVILLMVNSWRKPFSWFVWSSFSFMNQGSASSNTLTVFWMLLFLKDHCFLFKGINIHQNRLGFSPVGPMVGRLHRAIKIISCQETVPFHSFSAFQELSFLWFSLEGKKQQKNQWFCPHTLGRYPRLPQTPTKKKFLQKLLVKGQGYLPGVCGWDLRKKKQTTRGCRDLMI